jgi:hypothetical protein
MRIDDDDRRIGRQNRIDLIRRYQEAQAKLDAGGGKEVAKLDQAKLEKMSAGELLKELQKLVDRAQEAAKVDLVQRDTQHAEIQRQAVDGTVKSAEAVSSAQKQQTRGENWQKFEDHDRGDLPASVEEKARAEKAHEERGDLERQEKDRLSVRELQNDMAVQQKMIRG